MRNSRKVAPLALATALVLGMAGCNMVAPQATTIPYSPADGANVPDSAGPLKVRNALVVADDDGTAGNLLAGIVNDTDAAATLTIGYDGQRHAVRVDAHESVSLGFDGVDPILISDLDAEPGTTVEMTFQSGDGAGAKSGVPVLDGTLDYLADFVPAS